jgi:ATP synthase subunit 6
MLLYSPLSQFQIIPIIKIQLFFIDISFTNMLLINILSLVCFLNFLYMNSLYVKKVKEFSSFFISNSWQKIVEFVPEVSIQIISDIITKKKEQYFPIIAVILNFILFSNIIGLIPYSFTTTSHLVITFTLSFSVFIGINIITIEKYKMEMFSLFLPSKSKFFLSLLLVPIELISYIAKPISLGVRLFINFCDKKLMILMQLKTAY